MVRNAWPDYYARKAVLNDTSHRLVPMTVGALFRCRVIFGSKGPLLVPFAVAGVTLDYG